MKIAQRVLCSTNLKKIRAIMHFDKYTRSFFIQALETGWPEKRR